MVQFCCVVGCGNRSNRERKKFYRLPHIPKSLDVASPKALLISKRRSQWLLNIARVDLKDGDSAYSPGYIRVCSDHFYTGELYSLIRLVSYTAIRKKANIIIILFRLTYLCLVANIAFV